MQTRIEQPLAQRLLAAERLQLERILPNLTGYHLLTLGDWFLEDALETSIIRHRICLCPGHNFYHTQSGFANVCGCYDKLPFLDDSIDVILLAHTLEVSEDTEQVLEEVWRCLIPQGHAIIFGCNLFSLFGFRRLFHLLHCPGRGFPWHRRFHSIGQTRRLLLKSGFEITMYNTFYFRPPLNSHAWHEYLGFMEFIGEFVWPYFGGGYVFVVKKRIMPLTPIKPKWQQQGVRVKGGVVEPTARS